MNQLALIGHNSPPDPIDEALAPFGDTITEAESWLDGKAVETEAQMKAADALIKEIKSARKAVDEARDTATKPLHEAWKGEVARWKPTQDDLDRIVKGLVGIVDGFKRKLAAEKEAARKEAERRAWEATRAAQEAARLADATNIEATRTAAAAIAEAEAMQAQARIAAKDTVKGLRTVHHHAIEDHRAALHWIAANDREAVTAFIEGYAAKHFKEKTIAGVRVWKSKEAF